MPIDKITEIDPVDVALEMLNEELPGFKSIFSKRHMAVQVTGALRVGAQTDVETFYYPIPNIRTYGDLVQTEKNRARETPSQLAERLESEKKYIRRMIEPVVRHIVDQARTLGIEALNLEKVMLAREEKVDREARKSGYELGKEEGRREGRKEAFRELIEAANIDWGQLLGEDI